MPVIGITGSIATGKSTFAALLRRDLPAELFDADRCARGLLDEDPGIQKAVSDSLGAEVFCESGKPDRVRLRQLVFSDPQSRKNLESILHPSIRSRWLDRAKQVRAANGWLCVDIPLLFETSAEPNFDAVVVVGCSGATQQKRLAELRHLDADLSTKIVAAQLDLWSKIAKSHHLIWNDSSVTSLDQQSALLSACLRQRHC